MKTMLLRPPQIKILEDERKLLNDQLNGPWKHLIQNQGQVRRRLQDVERQLAEGKPQPVTGAERDRLANRERELREKFTQGMLSQEEMRKNPPGAVDHHRRWESTNKNDILEWKEIRLRLHADNSDPQTWNRDEANIELFRPEGARGRVRLDAQIPGVSALTPEAKANYDQVFPSEHKPKKRAWTDAQRAAAGERLAKVRAAKKLRNQEAQGVS